MKDYGLVSIITPTWNCGRFIGETIESVLAQTYPDWEMIIVDDCSTDNTTEVVSRYKDSRISYHCLDKNSGAAVARNTALRLAKGRWVAFLDSDDLWKPEKLEHQLKFMVENNYSFTYHNYSEIDEEGGSMNKLISGPKRINRLAMLSYCWPGCLTVMYDNSAIGKLQIPDIKKNNDYAMWLCISKKHTCFLLDENLAFYRKRRGSVSNHSYSALVKWHYRLFRTVENTNVLVSWFYTINNLVWGAWKKIWYNRHFNVK